MRTDEGESRSQESPCTAVAFGGSGSTAPTGTVRNAAAMTQAANMAKECVDMVSLPVCIVINSKRWRASSFALDGWAGVDFP